MQFHSFNQVGNRLGFGPTGLVDKNFARDVKDAFIIMDEVQAIFTPLGQYARQNEGVRKWLYSAAADGTTLVLMTATPGADQYELFDILNILRRANDKLQLETAGEGSGVDAGTDEAAAWPPIGFQEYHDVLSLMQRALASWHTLTGSLDYFRVPAGQAGACLGWDMVLNKCLPLSQHASMMRYMPHLMSLMQFGSFEDKMQFEMSPDVGRSAMGFLRKYENFTTNVYSYTPAYTNMRSTCHAPAKRTGPMSTCKNMAKS